MKSENFEDRLKHVREAILCIVAGTLSGLGVYAVFLHFNIAIFGWNFGLVFAPLTAGYVETILAHKIIGEDIGAISAFILFAYTTFYSFILNNPTLGINIITAGSVFVILQSAFPTLINYLIVTGGIGILSYLSGIFKKITTYIYNKLKSFYYIYILDKPYEVKSNSIDEFDEKKSNQLINGLDFIFMTSTDVEDRYIINVGQFESIAILEKAKHIAPTNPDFEIATINILKAGKDECLVELSNKIKAAGGNGVIDLDIQYSLIGVGGEYFQVSAVGMGVYIK